MSHDQQPPDEEEREFPPTSGPRLSVVIPAHNSSTTLTESVRAVVDAAGPFDEIIIADDGSTDGCVAALDQLLLGSVKVVTSPRNIGKGPIRNLGVESSSGEVLVFVDSDVALERSALERIRAAFTSDPDRVALIGSYDDHPGDPGLVSQYRNLLHHHTHQTHGETATHFWTGIGAIRRDVFIEMGGLDTRRWARHLEDVEFGHRLIDAGHTIDVFPEIRGTHYKRFTVRSMVEVDLWHRAVPWSHLMLADGLRIDHFVVSPAQVLSGVFVAVLIVSLVLTPLVPTAAWVALASLAAFIAVNARLWRTLASARGLRFAVLCIPLHLLETTVSGLGVVIAVGQRLRRMLLPSRRSG